MALNGTIIQARPGLMGSDTTKPLNRVSVKRLFDSNQRFCVRYVAHQSTHSSFVDLSESEAQIIIDAGLGLMVVQHPLAAGWVPTAPLGKEFGQNATNHAADAGLPPGVTVFLDLEEVKPGTPAEDVIAF